MNVGSLSKGAGIWPGAAGIGPGACMAELPIAAGGAKYDGAEEGGAPEPANVGGTADGTGGGAAGGMSLDGGGE